MWRARSFPRLLLLLLVMGGVLLSTAGTDVATRDVARQVQREGTTVRVEQVEVLVEPCPRSSVHPPLTPAAWSTGVPARPA